MGHPIRHKSLVVLLALLVLCGCASKPRRRPDAVYGKAESYRRSGQLTEALATARLGFSAWRRSGSSVWYWRFRLLTAEILLAQGATTQALEYLSDAPPPDADRVRIRARLLMDRGNAAYRQGLYEEAPGLLDHAYEAATAASALELIPEIQLRRATLLIRTRKFEQAEALTRDAVEVSGRSGDRYVESNALAAMGYLVLNRGRYDEAIQWFERSLAISRPAGFNAVNVLTLINLGWCHFRLGDSDRAGADYSEAEALAGRTGQKGQQQVVLGHMGNVRYSLGDYVGAVGYYRRALVISEELRDQLWRPNWLGNLATTYLAIGDVRMAEDYNRRALDALTQRDLSTRGWALLNRARIDSLRRDYGSARQAYDEALEAAAGDPDLSWETHAGLAGMYRETGDRERARVEFERAIEVVDSSWSRLTNDQSKLTFPSRLVRFYRENVDYLMGAGRAVEALEFVESRRARLLAEKMGTESQAALTSVQKVISTTPAVLISYWLAPGKSYAWFASRGVVRAAELPGEEEIRQLVERHSKAIQDGRESAAARQLYDMLVGPTRDMVRPEAQVVLVADGALHGLNFETLMDPQGRYWIENTTVEIIPSLRLLAARRQPVPREPSILLIGDPVSGDASLPHLDFARAEIADIAALFRDKVEYTGAAARPESYAAAEPKRFSMIHFAAHAIGNRENPLDSAVVLSRGRDSFKLYAREVQKIGLGASLVTVSACRSAGARTYAGEGLVGFAWAFLSAGAQNVVASLWDVNDRSTADFMTAFYARLRSGRNPAAALRETKLEFLRSAGARRRPYYWAPFQLYVR